MKLETKLKYDKKTLTESLMCMENKLFNEYTRILVAGTDEEKEEFLNWEEMDDTEKRAFAKALGNHIVAITCECFDEYTINRSKWTEITHMVGKEIVLQMTQMWL